VAGTVYERRTNARKESRLTSTLATKSSSLCRRCWKRADGRAKAVEATGVSSTYRRQFKLSTRMCSSRHRRRQAVTTTTIPCTDVKVGIKSFAVLLRSTPHGRKDTTSQMMERYFLREASPCIEPRPKRCRCDSTSRNTTNIGKVTTGFSHNFSRLSSFDWCAKGAVFSHSVQNCGDIPSRQVCSHRCGVA
jgi:hypothetical protein